MTIKRLLLTFSSLFAVACAAEDAGNAPVDAPPEPTLAQQLVGVWKHTTNHLAVDNRADGTWLAASSVEGLLLPTNEGTYTIDGNVLHIYDPFCGKHSWIVSITDDVLSIAPNGVDTCPGAMAIGTFTRVDGPAVLAGDSLLDEVISRGGDLIDDVRRDIAGSNYVQCTGCTVVAKFELSRPRPDRYQITHQVYYDQPYQQAKAGDLACTSKSEIAVRRLDGYEPNEAVDLYWIVGENTCGWTLPLSFHSVWRATRRDGEGPTQIAEWDASLGATFPGWTGEGGKASIYQLCPDANKNSFGYCQPTCTASEQPDHGGTCILPAPQ